MGALTSAIETELSNAGKIVLDSVILIYHLEDVEPYSNLTEIAIAMIAEGSVTALLSSISVTELLAKPFAEKRDDRVADLERFLVAIPNLQVIAPGYAIARRAACLRGMHGIRTPDALILATALEEKAGALLTNDSRLRKFRSQGTKILILDDYVSK